MLKPLKPNSFWSLPFHSFLSSSLCLLLPSFLLFSLLNCKYQVPFILFCYFCYYCYYIVVLVIFFFFSSRPVQQRPDCLSSVAVCKYDFISVPFQEGKNRTKCFIFILSPSISLFTTFSFPHKCCHKCFIYCIVFFWQGMGDLFFSTGVVKLRDYSFSFFFFPLPNLSPAISHAK